MAKDKPQKDSFTPRRKLHPASKRDISRYRHDTGKYDIQDYGYTCLRKHCRGCEYRKGCIATK